jgi:predicted nucleic acid-binding protein
LETEGKQTADLRADLLRQDFIVNVDWELAKKAAMVWKKYHVPMADAVIAATAMHLKACCMTNDEHFLKMKELETKWV